MLETLLSKAPTWLSQRFEDSPLPGDLTMTEVDEKIAELERRLDDRNRFGIPITRCVVNKYGGSAANAHPFTGGTKPTTGDVSTAVATAGGRDWVCHPFYATLTDEATLARGRKDTDPHYRWGAGWLGSSCI